MKKFTAMMLAIVLLVSLFPAHLVTAYAWIDDSPVVQSSVSDEAEVDEALEARVADVTETSANQTVLSVLHLNDSHGRFDVGIHYARLATIANEYRALNPNTLVLDAGDAIHGTNFANMFRGESMIDLMNLIGFDALVAGNHEFNFGQAHLLELDARADFPILGANVLNADGTNYLTPYTIIELEDVTVGIFGLATPTTPTVTNPNNVIGLTFTDPVFMAQNMVDHLSPQVDVVIALTHLGLAGVRGSQDVAAAVEGIDLIVEGHCHSVRPNGVIVNGTTIATVGAHAANLGTVEIILEEGEVVSVEAGMYTAEDVADVVHDPVALALMGEYMDELDEVLAEHVGYSESFLNNAYVRRAETALGNLTGDLFLEVTGADVAMMNSGGIRDHLHAGAITVGDVFNIFPFGNVIEVHEISGQVLLDAIENSVSMFALNNPIQSHGRFPQIAGMSFTFDISQPSGSRVSNLLVGGQPVDLTATYTMATSGFVGAGGDGFTMIPEYGTFIGEFGSIDENLTAFIRSQGGSVTARIEGRILMRDADGYVRNPDVTEIDFTANNFVIHVDDVPSMDIAYLSGATLKVNDVVVDATFSHPVEIEGVGVYQIPFTATYDQTLFDDIGYIAVFVVDDTVAWSDEYVIFNEGSVTMPFEQRVSLTAEGILEAGDFEAYRVVDGELVTELLVVNETDLQAIQTATESGAFDVRVNLNPEAMISMILIDECVGDDCEEVELEEEEEDNRAGGGGNRPLPQTGTAATSVVFIGFIVLTLGLVAVRQKRKSKLH